MKRRSPGAVRITGTKIPFCVFQVTLFIRYFFPLGHKVVVWSLWSTLETEGGPLPCRIAILSLQTIGGPAWRGDNGCRHRLMIIKTTQWPSRLGRASVAHRHGTF